MKGHIGKYTRRSIWLILDEGLLMRKPSKRKYDNEAKWMSGT